MQSLLNTTVKVLYLNTKQWSYHVSKLPLWIPVWYYLTKKKTHKNHLQTHTATYAVLVCQNKKTLLNTYLANRYNKNQHSQLIKQERVCDKDRMRKTQ